LEVLVTFFTLLQLKYDPIPAGRKRILFTELWNVEEKVVKCNAGNNLHTYIKFQTQNPSTIVFSNS
jgi:hypothetical protein